MSTSKRYSPEVQERAVRLVFDQQAAHGSQWAAIVSVAEKIGCTRESLCRWVRQFERDHGRRPGTTTDERERVKALEREVQELRRANDMALPEAPALFLNHDCLQGGDELRVLRNTVDSRPVVRHPR